METKKRSNSTNTTRGIHRITPILEVNPPNYIVVQYSKDYCIYDIPYISLPKLHKVLKSHFELKGSNIFQQINYGIDKIIEDCTDDNFSINAIEDNNGDIFIETIYDYYNLERFEFFDMSLLETGYLYFKDEFMSLFEKLSFATTTMFMSNEWDRDFSQFSDVYKRIDKIKNKKDSYWYMVYNIADHYPKNLTKEMEEISTINFEEIFLSHHYNYLEIQFGGIIDIINEELYDNLSEMFYSDNVGEAVVKEIYSFNKKISKNFDEIKIINSFIKDLNNSYYDLVEKIKNYNQINFK